MKTIILDANVLLSNTLRGLFLWMSWKRLCVVVWSELLWDEVFRNYSSDSAKEKLFREKVNIDIFANFPDSMRQLKPGYTTVGLPDANDEHIVALARQEDIQQVVTFNLKDFPDKVVSGFGIRCQGPDQFLCEWFGAQSDEIKTAIREHIMYLRKSKPTKASYFASLRKAGLKEFVEILEAEDDAGNLFAEVWS